MNGLSLYILFILHTASLLVQPHCVVIAKSENLHFIAQDQRVKRFIGLYLEADYMKPLCPNYGPHIRKDDTKCTHDHPLGNPGFFLYKHYFKSLMWMVHIKSWSPQKPRIPQQIAPRTSNTAPTHTQDHTRGIQAPMHPPPQTCSPIIASHHFCIISIPPSLVVG